MRTCGPMTIEEASMPRTTIGLGTVLIIVGIIAYIATAFAV